jgi:hypothetical protein
MTGYGCSLAGTSQVGSDNGGLGEAGAVAGLECHDFLFRIQGGGGRHAGASQGEKGTDYRSA